MPQAQTCPQCGAELPPDSPDGLCPDCLLKMALPQQGATNEAGAEIAGSATTAASPGGGFVPPTVEQLDELFPQLEVLQLLGHGGMGAVYKARQKNLDRLVALKVIHPQASEDPAFAERFAREARTLARLNHPHIVAVYDFGEIECPPSGEAQRGGERRKLFYFLMEYVDGLNLRQVIGGGHLDARQALAIVPQLCDALQYAHDEGVVHRDIKPENILLDRRGRVKVADFGLAKLAAGSPQEFTLTGTFQVVGTPRYMAPEQMTGSRLVDHRADIYSLGVVIYEMLTGDLPLGMFKPPSQAAAVDARLDEVVLKTLQREPEARYQHAGDVKTDIESISSLAPLEPPAVKSPGFAAPAKPPAAYDPDAALWQVRGPAIGLVVVAVLTVLPAVTAIVAAIVTAFTTEVFIDW